MDFRIRDAKLVDDQMKLSIVGGSIDKVNLMSPAGRFGREIGKYGSFMFLFTNTRN